MNFDKKNSDRNHEIYSETLTDGWHIFWKANKDFNYESSYNIRYRSFSMGYPKYDINDLKHIKGTVYAPLRETLNCRMKLYTFTRERYASEIELQKVKIRKLEKRVKDKNKELSKLINKGSKYKAKFQSYGQQLVKLEDQMNVAKLEYTRIDRYTNDEASVTHTPSTT